MTARTKRIFFYITVALICYAVAATFGTGAGFVAFLIAGVVGELFFWGELIWGDRSG